MAARTTKKRPTPLSAQEKEANAAIQQSGVLGLEQQQARTAQQSRGSYSPRRLRAGGTDLQRYLIGGYTSDPFPKAPASPTRRTRKPKAPTGPRTRKPTNKKSPRVPTYTRKQRTEKQNKLSDDRAREMERIRKERERKAKAAEAARRAKKRGPSTRGGGSRAE